MVCGESQLTQRGRGRLRATGVEFKMVCRRCTSPLGGWGIWWQWLLANCLGMAIPPATVWILFGAKGFTIGTYMIGISLGIA
jgi:hypothetical protein